MKHDHLEQATRKLLETLGLRQPAGQDAARTLQGSGMVLEPAAIVGGTVHLGDDVVGGVAGGKEGPYIAFVVRKGSAFVIEDGDKTPSRSFSLENMDARNRVWLLARAAGDMQGAGAFLRKHIGRFGDLLVCSFLINLFALVLPFFSSFVYDKILGNGILDTLWAIVIGLVFIFAIEFCIRMVRIALSERFAEQSDADIDHSIFRNLLDISGNRVPSIGVMLEKYKQVVAYRDFLSSSYLLSLADLPFLLLFLGFVAVVAGPIVLVPIVCGAVVLAASMYLMQYEAQYIRLSRITGERKLALLADVLTSRDAVVGDAFRRDLSRRWQQESVGTAITSSKSRYWRGFSASVVNSISYISFIAVLVIGAYMVEAHSITAGGLLAASMLTSRAMSTMGSLVNMVLRYREFNTAVRELNQILPQNAAQKRSQTIYGRLAGAIRMDSLECRLGAADRPALVVPKCEIKAGEVVGIAGAPGAGKTTLMRLIAGVLKPDAGQVLIDDLPVDALAHEDMTINIGFKPQELCLMEGTIEDNIRAGRHDITAQQLADVLELSGLGVAFRETGLSWHTQVGARGMYLSGGQRQLVAIARAMVTKPAVLLLDEPTNGLDAVLEAHLAKQIAALRGHSTVVVSAHSKSILSLCDHIIVLGNGRVLADGPRDKILVQ